VTSAAGFEAEFESVAARHRRELHVHCYRMVASYDEAEDAVQEAFARAWRSRSTFDGQNMRAWLYKIATRVCLDTIRARSARGIEVASYADLPWLTPYPDRFLDEVAPSAGEPEASVVARETIELALLAALQALPPRQRAAFIAREVLGLPVAEIAEFLDSTVAATNSALQRARATMKEHLPSHRTDWTPRKPSPDEQRLLQAFIEAHQRNDAKAALAAAAADIRVTMPPSQLCFEGHVELVTLLKRALGPDREGDWLLVPAAVNRMPAAASYLRRRGESAYSAYKLDVLRVEADRIAEITTFGVSELVRLGMPPVQAP
jgi:RNA polymerase sigma-70 factor (TIGR02960 family)